MALAPDDGLSRPGSLGAWQIREGAWSQADKWASLAPGFRRELEGVFAALRREGYSPRLGFGWRPLSTQAAMVSSGASQASFSRHNPVDAALRPAALAADVVGDGSDAFARRLRALADARGLRSGGWFGVPRDAGNASAPLGWDPLHVEQSTPSTSELRRTVLGYYSAHGIDPYTGERTRPVGPLPGFRAASAVPFALLGIGAFAWARWRR